MDSSNPAVPSAPGRMRKLNRAEKKHCKREARDAMLVVTPNPTYPARRHAVKHLRSQLMEKGFDFKPLQDLSKKRVKNQIVSLLVQNLLDLGTITIAPSTTSDAVTAHRDAPVQNVATTQDQRPFQLPIPGPPWMRHPLPFRPPLPGPWSSQWNLQEQFHRVPPAQGQSLPQTLNLGAAGEGSTLNDAHQQSAFAPPAQGAPGTQPKPFYHSYGMGRFGVDDEPYISTQSHKSYDGMNMSPLGSNKRHMTDQAVETPTKRPRLRPSPDNLRSKGSAPHNEPVSQPDSENSSFEEVNDEETEEEKEMQVDFNGEGANCV